LIDLIDNILVLTLGACAILLALTLSTEVVRMRAPEGADMTGVDVFMTRIRSWWAMVILFSLALVTGLTGVVILFALAAFAALREFYTFSDKTRADHPALAMAFFVILPAQFLFVWLGWSGLFAVFIPVYAFLLLPVVQVLRGDARRFLVRVAETQWGLMICVYCTSHVPALMTLPVTSGRGVLLIAFLVIAVQGAELLDFYFGRRFGNRRIAPGLSPKTWEGLAASVALITLIGMALHGITPFGPLGAAMLAAVAALSGMAGKLVMTAIKRDKGLRDWSHLIPGHGGFLDQMDGVIFAAPILYHITRLVWLPV
jgi:phosphatidate cytidylyltransferase